MIEPTLDVSQRCSSYRRASLPRVDETCRHAVSRHTIEDVRAGAIAAALGSAMLVLVVSSSKAHAADPRVVLVRDFQASGKIEARPDGRAWLHHAARSRGVFVLGPGDEVQLTTNPPTDEQEQPGEDEEPRLSLGLEGTILRGSTRAALPDALLHALGPKIDRSALAYDVTGKRYVLLRSRRPRFGARHEDVVSIVWFTIDQGVVDDVVVPNIPPGDLPNLAAANGVVWLSFMDGVLRLDGTGWTHFIDEEKHNRARAREQSERRTMILAGTAFTLGNAAGCALLSLPVSAIGKQSFAPTATTSFVGSVPALGTAALMTLTAVDKSQLSRAITGFVGTLTMPVVALATYATGELAFGGTNEGAYLGALGGTAAGSVLWWLASHAFDEKSLDKGWWWILPIGGAVIGTSSTTGYLWAGEGFSRY